jgi:hypothetical protein
MATIEEITAVLEKLSAASLAQVRALAEALAAREKETRALAWSFDFLDHFSDATRAGMEIQIAQATCAGAARPALWEHPPMTGSASVGYLVPIPTGVRQIKLKFAVGIRDGAELPADRYVAFRVMVNGWKLWSTVKNSHAWEEHEIKMPQLSSDVARIEFITNGLGDNRWNWAVWGDPRLEGE